MNTIRLSPEPGRSVVDYWLRVEPFICADEPGSTEVHVMAGPRRTENNQNKTAENLRRKDDEPLPSEIFIG